jgi:hypothetical protein
MRAFLIGMNYTGHFYAFSHPKVIGMKKGCVLTRLYDFCIFLSQRHRNPALRCPLRSLQK